MPSIEEVLELHHECGSSRREIARSSGLFAGAVNKLLCLAGKADSAWPSPADMNQMQLQHQLHGRPAHQMEAIDFAVLHEQLEARNHLTLQRLGQEYRQK